LSLLSLEDKYVHLIRSAIVAGLASIPSLIMPYFPAPVIIAFLAIEFIVAFRSEVASLSLGLALSVPAAIYQNQVFGLYYFFLILIPLWTMMILTRAHEEGWIAGVLSYVGVQLGWSGPLSSLSFLPPALSGVLFTPRTGLFMGLTTALCVIFLAYAQGATSYGFMNLNIKTSPPFMNFPKQVPASFGPMDLIQPILGLTNPGIYQFNRYGFDTAVSALPSLFLSASSVAIYIEIALWTIACYLPSRIAMKWKGPYQLSLGLLSTLAMTFSGYVLTGFMLTGGYAITAEVLAVGVFVPIALAAGIAVFGFERITGTEVKATNLSALFRRRPKAEKQEAPLSEDTQSSRPTEKPTELIQLEEAFSRSLGVTHEEMVGRKILFDYDPVSEYENAIKDFCVEALANRGLATVFTRKGSPIHNTLSERAAIKFFCLTSQVSVPTEATRNEVWLPANDISLMLDALNKNLLANPKALIWFVYDNLTELLFATGFERTFGFLRYATEILAPQRVSALFLFNSKAHDDKISISIKGLFRNYVEYGSEGPKLVRFPRQQQ